MRRIFSLSTAFLTFLVIPLMAVRLLLNPALPSIEYQMPGFPADSYGFDTAERVHWGSLGVEYLLNSAGPEFLGDLRFEDGSAVFNEREVSHMLDVKIVVGQVMMVFYAALTLLFILGLVAWRTNQMETFYLGLEWGGYLTFGVILGLGLIASVSFWQFFTAFHGIFFQGDTWIFAYSDTLIRLYPIRFWQDVALYILGGAMLVGAALGFFLRRRRFRSKA